MKETRPPAVLHRQGFHALAQDLGSDVNTAAKEKENFMKAMPGLRKWQACAESVLGILMLIFMLILRIHDVAEHSKRT